MRLRLSSLAQTFGPGVVVAATGVGAGDLIAASVAGARYGTAVLWAVLLGALIKFVLNEGVARWQLATGSSILEGWTLRLPRAVSLSFLVFLFFWGFLVAAALINACALAAQMLVPTLSLTAWGLIHAGIAFALVWFGHYNLFERVMRILTALMFVVVITSAVALAPEWSSLLRGITIPSVPPGAGKFLLGVIGGVGGSVTLLSYGYWIRERGWSGVAYGNRCRIDLGVAYGLTGFFAVALVVIAAGATPQGAGGPGIMLEMADRLQAALGPVARWSFLIGFWSAVATSLLGVCQGVPYLFDDYVRARRQARSLPPPPISGDRSPYYRAFLAYLAFPPTLLLLVNRPILVVLIYAVAGSLFMPFLASSLLYMNNRRDWVGSLRNGWLVNALLTLALVIFGYIFVSESVDTLRPYLTR